MPWAAPTHTPPRPPASKRGYGARHRRWRAAVLARDPICRGWPPGSRCLSEATVGDHVTPLRLGGAPYELENGQGLCRDCHWLKTRAGL